MSNSNFSEQIIKEYVSRFEHEFGANSGEVCFQSCLTRMGMTKLQYINQQQVETIVQPLLYQWGRMGRVLGRSEFSNWQENLAGAIRNNADRLEHFRSIVLEDSDLAKEYQDVISCYDSFKTVVYPIAAVKALHLICPSFFPLWDNDIAEAVIKELVAQDKPPETNAAFSSDYYWAFINGVQSFARNNRELLGQLSIQYKRSTFKILDEVLWWATHRPLCLIMGVEPDR